MATEKKPKTADIARALALPVLEALGLELWDLRFEKEGGEWYLRYYIDKDGGVDIKDCEAFSRAVDKLLDEADPIEQSYILEVSSPGIERALTRPEHFERYGGHKIAVRLIRPLDGKRDYAGILIKKDADGLLIEQDGAQLLLPAAQIAFVKLHADLEI